MGGDERRLIVENQGFQEWGRGKIVIFYQDFAPSPNRKKYQDFAPSPDGKVAEGEEAERGEKWKD